MRTLDLILKEKKIFLRLVSSLLIVMILPLTLFAIFYYNHLSRTLALKANAQGRTVVLTDAQSIDELIILLNKIAMSIDDERFFSPDYIKTNLTAYLNIQNRLRSLTYISEKLDSVFYICDVNDTVYTNTGTYRLSLLDGSSFPACPRAEYISFDKKSTFASALTGTLVFNTNSNLLEYGVSVHYGHGKIVFSIKLDAILPARQEASYFLYSTEGELLAISSSANEAVALQGGGFDSLEGIRGLTESFKKNMLEYQEVPLKASLAFSALVSSAWLLQDIYEMNTAFVLYTLLVGLVTSVLVSLLVRRTYAPIKQLNQNIRAIAACPQGLNEVQTAQYAVEQLRTQNLALSKLQENLMREKYVQQLLRSNIDEPLLEQCYKLNVLKPEEPVVVLILQLKEDAEESSAPFLLDQILNKYGMTAFSEIVPNVKYAYIFTPSDEQALQRLSEVKTLYEQKTHSPLCLGISNPQKNVQRIGHAYRQADLALQMLKKGLCEYRLLTTEKKLKIIYPHMEIEALYAAAIAKNADRVLTLSDMLLHTVHKMNNLCKLPLSLCYDIINTLSRALLQLESTSSKVDSGNKYLHGDYDLHTLGDFKAALDCLVKAITETASDTQTVFIAAQKLIQQHLTNNDLYAEWVADQLQIPFSQLNTIFKDKTSLTLAAYINVCKHRFIQHALLSSNISIKELSETLGYSQPSSLIRNFKNIEGMTPGQYRLQHPPHDTTDS